MKLSTESCVVCVSCFLVNSADRTIRVYESGEVLACGKDGEPEPIQKLQDLVNRSVALLCMTLFQWCSCTLPWQDQGRYELSFTKTFFYDHITKLTVNYLETVCCTLWVKKKPFITLPNVSWINCIKSASSNRFDIRPSQLVTVGDHPFASGPKVWNSLSEDVTSAPSLPVFRRKLKTHLYRHSYPDMSLPHAKTSPLRHSGSLKL